METQIDELTIDRLVEEVLSSSPDSYCTARYISQKLKEQGYHSINPYRVRAAIKRLTEKGVKIDVLKSGRRHKYKLLV